MLIRLHESKFHGDIDRWVNPDYIVAVYKADNFVRVDMRDTASFMMDGDIKEIVAFINECKA